LKKTLKLIAALGLLLFIGAGLYYYWQYERYYPSTQDAYVRANIVYVAPQITGQVASVDVVENQKVKAGDLLFTIEPTLMAAAVEQAFAQLDAATKQAESSASQIEAAKTAVASAQSTLEAASNQASRTRILADKGDVSRTALEQAQATQAQAQAALAAARAQLQGARSRLAAKQDSIRSAQAQVQIAQADLTWTRIIAPVDGWVSNLTLRPGSAVAAYTPKFAIIAAKGWWVDANFKETDIPRIRPGQPVKITVDLLPGKTLTGKVASISRGSGATFALLPPENASGNFVKVTQRFSVRVQLDPSRLTLRVGASVTAQVDTTVKPAPLK